MRLCDYSHIPIFFALTGLRTLSKPENMSPSAQGTQIPVRFVCVYVLSTLSFIVVSNRVCRCLNHCFRSFRSLFESISIDYKLMELNYFVFETFHLLTLLGSLILYVCTRAWYNQFSNGLHVVWSCKYIPYEYIYCVGIHSVVFILSNNIAQMYWVCNCI